MNIAVHYDKNGTQIKAGDVLFNWYDANGYYKVIADDRGNLFLGDLDSPLGKYSPETYWEITDAEILR